jgi:ATP-binding cassette subfamily B protein
MKTMKTQAADLTAAQLMLDLLRPYRGRIAVAVVALLVAAACQLLTGQGLRMVIDRGFVASDPAMLDTALMGLFAIIAIMAAAAYTRFYNVSWLGERVTADLRARVFNHLLDLPPSFFEAGRTGDVISRLTNDTTQLETVVGSSASMAMRNLLLLVGGMVMLLATSLKLTLLVLLCVPLVVVPILLFGRRVKKLARASQDRIADIGSFIDETVHEMRVVQAYGHEDKDRAAFAQRVEQAFQTGRNRIQQRASLIAAVMLLVFGAIASILWIGGHDVLAGTISAGQLSAFVFYAAIVATAVATISEVYGDLQRASGATGRLLELLRTEADIRSPANPRELKLPARGELNIDAISFNYPSQPDHPAMKEFSLRVASGEKVALVGSSGAGKTTLFQLLLRFYDPQQGAISFDGIPLSQLDPRALRRQIALVPQEPVIFAASVMENVRYARPDASLDEVKSACAAAYADEFIQRLPEGYDSYLGERGVRLSGGQRQRIAIARAILADRPLLLLDEATSALDAESERQVQQALERLMEHRTTLIIAHRLATVVHADRIVVMEHGRVATIGTHEELIRSNDLYQNFARLQLMQ